MSQPVAAEARVGGMGVGKGGQPTRLSPTIAAFCYVSSLDVGERFLSDVTPQELQSLDNRYRYLDKGCRTPTPFMALPEGAWTRSDADATQRMDRWSKHLNP